MLHIVILFCFIFRLYLQSFVIYRSSHCQEILYFTLPYFISYEIGSMFSTKDKIPSFLRSMLVYKFVCASCNACYVGETAQYIERINRRRGGTLVKNLWNLGVPYSREGCDPTGYIFSYVFSSKTPCFFKVLMKHGNCPSFNKFGSFFSFLNLLLFSIISYIALS